MAEKLILADEASLENSDDETVSVTTIAHVK